MSGGNLNDTEARFTGTTCGGGESRNDVLNTIDRERSGHRIASGESQRARGHDIVPTPFTFGDRSMACPPRVRAGLAPGMRQLHPGPAALLMHQPRDSIQRLALFVHPPVQVLPPP